MTEKEKIEYHTAKIFIKEYNIKVSGTFEIKEHSDHPDFVCRDKQGDCLRIEITMTEDQPGDIQALLNRSNHKNLNYVRRHGIGKASSLLGNVSENIRRNICSHMNKDYGNNVALVVRDTSPMGWDWEICIPKLKTLLANRHNPFDMGIWILCTSEFNNKIYRVM